MNQKKLACNNTKSYDENEDGKYGLYAVGFLILMLIMCISKEPINETKLNFGCSKNTSIAVCTREKLIECDKNHNASSIICTNLKKEMKLFIIEFVFKTLLFLSFALGFIITMWRYIRAYYLYHKDKKGLA